MKSPKMLRRKAAQRKQFMKKVFPYFTAAVLFIILIFTMGCAKPGKEPKNVSQYRVELGKKCLIKEDGSVAWSYVWIADQNVTLVKCK